MKHIITMGPIIWPFIYFAIGILSYTAVIINHKRNGRDPANYDDGFPYVFFWPIMLLCWLIFLPFAIASTLANLVIRVTR